jgi:cytochrome c-type biogenesis protein CcmH/NrfG
MKSKKIQILLVVGVIILIAVVFGLFWMAFTAEDRSMAKAAKEHPQGEKFLQEYRDAKAKAQKDPEDFGAYFEIGFVKAEFRDYQGAVEAYKKSYELNPNSIVALNNLADVYTKMKNYVKAEEMYLESIGRFPAYVQSYYAIIDLYQNFMPEKKAEIEKVLLKGLEGLPTDQNLLSLLAGYYRDTKQNDKAVAIYEKILELRPNDNLIREEIESLKAGK